MYLSTLNDGRSNKAVCNSYNHVQKPIRGKWIGKHGYENEHIVDSKTRRVSLRRIMLRVQISFKQRWPVRAVGNGTPDTDDLCSSAVLTRDVRFHPPVFNFLAITSCSLQRDRDHWFLCWLQLGCKPMTILVWEPLRFLRYIWWSLYVD